MSDTESVLTLNPPTLTDYFVTFGVQYRQFPRQADEAHPQGMHTNGYFVVEAADAEAARAITVALFGTRWSMLYEEQPNEIHFPAGEIGRFGWMTPNDEQPPAAPLARDLPADVYNELMSVLLTSTDRRAIFLADKVKNIFGASARRNAERLADVLAASAVGEEEIAQMFSEWTDDAAPLNLPSYRMAARQFLSKYDVTPKEQS